MSFVELNDTSVAYEEPEPALACLPDMTIDRKTPVPFYFQLAELLEDEIVSGRWQPGARVPSEGQLGDRYELSRTTIRQALARLEQEGLINRVKGRGTFVRDSRPRSWLIQSTEGFFGDELRRAGRSVVSRILRLERSQLPRWASDALGVAPDEDGLIIERIRSVDGLVALHVANYLPGFAADAAADLAPDESLYERLAQHGISITGAVAPWRPSTQVPSSRSWSRHAPATRSHTSSPPRGTRAGVRSTATGLG
jgi:GntR family transcriptional regulator